MTQHQTQTPFELAALAANAAESKKAAGTQVLDVGKISSISDYFVFCTGESPVQIKAIATAIVDKLEQAGHQPLGQERDRVGKWFLIDYGDIIIHVMHPQAREYYNIENFWNHATPIARDKWDVEVQKAS